LWCKLPADLCAIIQGIQYPVIILNPVAIFSLAVFNNIIEYEVGHDMKNYQARSLLTQAEVHNTNWGLDNPVRGRLAVCISIDLIIFRLATMPIYNCFNEILQIKFLRSSISSFSSVDTYLISFSFEHVPCHPPPHFSTDLVFFREWFLWRFGGGGGRSPIAPSPLATPLKP
jgi:hypothetical protein